MNPLGALRASLSRYRRRKLSLSGRAGGIEYTNYRHGRGREVQTGHALQHTTDSDYLGMRQPESYDPQVAFYHADVLAYDRPEPVRDSVLPGMPAIPSSGPLEHDVERLCSLEPTINHDQARWLLRNFANNAPSQPAPDAIPFDHDVRFDGSIGPTINDPSSDQTPIVEVWDAVLRRPTYEGSLMTQELLDQHIEATDQDQMLSGPDDSSPLADSEPMTVGESDPWDPEAATIDCGTAPVVPMAEPDALTEPTQHFEPQMEPAVGAYEAPGLDQLQYGPALDEIVEQDMQEMDPYAMMDPYHTLGPYGPMPDPRMMGMLMNPFGPMPPGLGPMGPM